MLSEINQTGKKNYSMLSFVCGIWKIKEINVYNKTETSKLTDIENKLVVTSGESEMRRDKIGVLD